MANSDAAQTRSDIPFPFGWYCWDLGEYRPFPTKYQTYGLFPYETLPPLPPLDSNFAFLGATDVIVAPTPPREFELVERQKLTLLSLEAAQRGLAIPPSFVHFMRSPKLHERFQSGTGYWFHLSNRLVPCPGFADAYLISFLRDQQDCCIWCLCLTPDGKSCVLALTMNAVEMFPEASMDILYGDSEDAAMCDDITTPVLGAVDPGYTLDAMESAMGEIWVCGASFEEFICRFWLEDEISFKLWKEEPLAAWEQRYLDHYEKLR